MFIDEEVPGTVFALEDWHPKSSLLAGSPILDTHDFTKKEWITKVLSTVGRQMTERHSLILNKRGEQFKADMGHFWTNS